MSNPLTIQVSLKTLHAPINVPENNRYLSEMATVGFVPQPGDTVTLFEEPLTDQTLIFKARDQFVRDYGFANNATLRVIDRRISLTGYNLPPTIYLTVIPV